jgi:hypothetical protein
LQLAILNSHRAVILETPSKETISWLPFHFIDYPFAKPKATSPTKFAEAVT